MKQNKTTLALALCTLLFGGSVVSSCDFEDINAPKYQVTDKDMEGDNFKLGAFFPQLQDIAYPAQENKYQMNENLIGDVYGRYMMTTKDGWSTSNFSVFNAPDNWVKSPFNDVMGDVYTAWNEIRIQTKGVGINFAWAQILRVAAIHRLTDIYGPIPYTKVASGEMKVPYDTQEVVYKAMLTDLTDAINTLTTYVIGNPGAKPMADYDEVYAGDFSKWVRFANSLKLRLAMRIRFVEPVLAQQMAEEAVSHIIGVIESNDDNAKYNYSKGNPIKVIWKDYSDTRVCADITAMMQGYNDPRMEKYFQLSQKINNKVGYVGIRSGVVAKSTAWSLDYSAPNIQKEDPLYWMYASEVTFLRAEGALVGWNMKGSAASLYNQAIALSFSQNGVAGVANYITDATKVPGDYDDPNDYASCTAASTITIKWDASDSQEKKLERIITQKWIALWPMGQEAWSEYRRTGYPKIFSLAQNTTYQGLKVANRIPFSSDEYLNNTENMAGAVQALGGEDNYATRLWWDKHRN